MNTHNTSGTVVLQEQTLTSHRINDLDLNVYFRQLAKVLEETKDKEGRIQTILLFKEEFLAKYNKHFNQALNDYIISELKKEFIVGQFYPTQVVKAKLRRIYNSEFIPVKFHKRTPKMIDLKKYKWFKFAYKSFPNSDEHLKGIEIISSLI